MIKNAFLSAAYLCLACIPLGQDADNTALLNEIEKRAVHFFIDQADPVTGLVSDRARNDGTNHPEVGSIASTGYGLAALPIAVERHWITRPDGEEHAARTLRWILANLPGTHGWYYHFVNRKTGAREWNCEVSSIDTGLLVMGALSAGRYFHGDVEKMANDLYGRMDWRWMRTNDGTLPSKLTLSHGWKPESGFINNNWDSYSEGVLLYLLGIGAEHGLPSESWKAWKRGSYKYDGLVSMAGGPIFLHEMVFGYFNLREMTDALGYNYWDSASNGVKINRLFCINNPTQRKTYGPYSWGLNAGDVPHGYVANGVPGPEDGTVSPSGVLAAIIFTPVESVDTVRLMKKQYGKQIWGAFGFSDGYNLDENWFDTAVVGIDVGMALLAVENYRTGLVWHLTMGHPAIKRALAVAGFVK